MSTAFKENQGGGYQSKCKWTVDLPTGSADDVHNYQVRPSHRVFCHCDRC
jgi:hypothetical protein